VAQRPIAAKAAEFSYSKDRDDLECRVPPKSTQAQRPQRVRASFIPAVAADNRRIAAVEGDDSHIPNWSERGHSIGRPTRAKRWMLAKHRRKRPTDSQFCTRFGLGAPVSHSTVSSRAFRTGPLIGHSGIRIVSGEEWCLICRDYTRFWRCRFGSRLSSAFLERMRSQPLT
jgi:hypothetical protein